MRTRLIAVYVRGGALGASVAYRSLIAPAATNVPHVAASATEAIPFVAPFEATAMSADGRDDESTLPAVTAHSFASEQRAVAPMPKF
jgi:hypothetical protein